MHPDDWTADEIGYALSKQLPTVTALATDYGELLLDEELAQAVAAALRPILERRLDAAGDAS